MESVDVLQVPIPSQCSPSQTLLKVIYEKLIILSLMRHLPRVHSQMSLRASVPLIFVEDRNLELRRYHNVWNQTEFMCLLTKHIFSTKDPHFLLHFLKFSFKSFPKVFHLIITSYTVCVVYLFVLLIGNRMNHWRCERCGSSNRRKKN